ncbi:hypothetical protein IAR55_003362 [Kwoniella newhampshirensis]|uniref:RING-type E3 ubiquitin transferase n=1 Tax=Kwoniella newhampshirensis TaxID=1651941 RepID=A0AAW0YWU0_9TREE
MSRRNFNTNLSNSNPKPSTSSTTTSSKRKNSISTGPTITPPDPDHAILHVPTHTSEEKQAILSQKSGSSSGEAGTPAEVDEDVCFICAEPITFWSVGVCGHRTCHVCAVRLRTFYKKTDCTFCKTPLPSLLFSRSPETPFPAECHVTPSPPQVIAKAHDNADKLPKGERWDKGLVMPGTLDVGAFPFGDEILGVVFEDEDMMEATLLLLRYNCPYQDCPFQAANWVSLERHTLSTHGLVICTLCRSQLSRFAHEQVLYPPHLLPLHDPSKVKRGQRPPRPRGDKEIELVKSWEAPHPLCEFCHQAFFGPDELFKHMRHEHEECHVCREKGDKDVYFQNYLKLEQHFNQDHFPCTQPSCLEKKFVVFPTDLDLRAHMVSEHSEQMSARDRAQARQLPVDFSDTSRRSGSSRQNQGQSARGFSLAQPFNPNGQAGPSRIRDVPSHQQLDQPSLTPAQVAQQQRQVKADRQEESRRRKGFATGLTRPAELSSAPSQIQSSAEADATSGSGFLTLREDVDDATATYRRHAELLSRVAMLTSDSTVKLSSFRSAVRQFKNNESGAKDLLDTLFHVFDRDVDTTAGIIREVASLFNGEGEADKQNAILEALNAFRVEQRDQFPSLGGNTPTGLGSNYAGIASGKILNAKRATQTGGARHSRSVWDRVEAAAASQPINKPTRANPNGRFVPGSGLPLRSNAAFPSLAAGPSTSHGGSSRSTHHSTPWVGGGAGSSSKSPTALTGPIIRSVNYPVAAPSKAKPLNNSAFPSLPSSATKPATTAAERKALFTKPTARDESIKRILSPGPSPAPVSNGWGEVTNGMEAMSLGGGQAHDCEGSAAPVKGGGGKKKGKGKQLLFSVSARP